MHSSSRWMRHFIRVLAAAGFAIAHTVALAQEVNGCGTGWNRYVVPDRLKIIGCEFKQSCDNHDRCYGACSHGAPGSALPQCEYLRCEANGDLFGTKTCDGIRFKRLRIKAEERRAKCDANFMVDIPKLNPGNARCTLFSAIYPSAVRILGQRACVGIDALQTAWTDAQKDAYAKAINDLYLQWSEERIERYVGALRRGDISVDFGKPIVFDFNLGLKNP